MSNFNSPGQPHDDRWERWLAGALLIGKTREGFIATEHLGTLEPADLLNEQCQEIVRTAKILHADGIAVDLSPIIDSLEQQGRLSPAWSSPIEAAQGMAKLMDDCPALWHVDEWAEHIQADSQRRRSWELSRNLMRDLSRPGVDPVQIAEAADEIAKLARAGKSQPSHQKITTLRDAATEYLTNLKSGLSPLIETGIPELDHAIGGGVEYGEMVLIAGRPGHGKSAVAAQIIHHQTAQGIPCAFLSEEMPALALGKRTVQFASTIHQEHWTVRAANVEQDLDVHFHDRAECYVVENCRTALAAADAIRRQVKDNGVRCVVVDYAQLLGGRGRTRYEQVTDVSITLRQVCNETGVLLVALCQLSREIEKRSPMIPHPSDLKDSGQLEQDADVIVFLVWPHRVDSSNDPKVFQFFIGKNRNREINAPAIVCRFEPSRQRITAATVDQREPDYSQGWK